MIKDRKLFEQFNRKYFKEKEYTLEEKFKIYDDLYDLARTLGVFPLKDPLQDIESCLRIARILNSERKNGKRNTIKNK